MRVARATTLRMDEDKQQRKLKQDKYKEARGAGIGFMIPMVMVSAVLVSCFIGYWLDRRLGTSPWLFLLFLVLGFVAAVREVIQLVKRLDSDE